jgi:hypothetical protein
MIYANLSKKGAAYITDGATIKRLVNGVLIAENATGAQLKNQINQLIKQGQKFETTAAAVEFLQVEKDKRRVFKSERKTENKAARAEFLAGLSPFWQDVLKRTGFDVITPFVENYPGFTFTPYDAGYIWVKEIKTAIKLQDFKSAAYLPKSCQSVVEFGANLDQIFNK